MCVCVFAVKGAGEEWDLMKVQYASGKNQYAEHYSDSDIENGVNRFCVLCNIHVLLIGVVTKQTVSIIPYLVQNLFNISICRHLLAM